MKNPDANNRHVSFSKRALSPIFSTLILAAVVVIAGTAAYIYATNATTTATNQYIDSTTANQQAISERIGFENVAYDPSTQALTVYIINCGNMPNLKITGLIIFNDADNSLLEYHHVTALYDIDTGTQIESLNLRQEAKFTVTLQEPLPEDFRIRIVTRRGNSFDYPA